jgi:hypothetical protein
MVRVRIFRHADIQALHKRSDQKLVSVDLVYLESVRMASDSCAVLVNLIQRRDWQCPNLLERRSYCGQMDLLLLMAGVALELHKIKDDLYPLVSEEAKLEGGFLKDLLLLKNSGVTLVRLAKEAKEIVEEDDDEDEDDEEDEEDVVRLLGQVKDLGKEVKDTADLVLKGTHNVAWLRAHLPSVLDQVDLLLSTPIRFSDPDGDSE